MDVSVWMNERRFVFMCEKEQLSVSYIVRDGIYVCVYTIERMYM